MKLYIRSNETDEVLHTILIADDDKRRGEIVEGAVGLFPPDSVYVSEDEGAETAADAPLSALTGDGHPVDDSVVAIPPDGEAEPT